MLFVPFFCGTRLVYSFSVELFGGTVVTEDQDT